MNTASDLTWVCLFLIVLILIRRFIIKKRFFVDRYEYLEAISYTEWKSGKLIRNEIRKLKNAYLSGPTFYANMARLGEEGLVECDVRKQMVDRYEIHEHFYRKKIGGRRVGAGLEKSPAISPFIKPA